MTEISGHLEQRAASALGRTLTPAESAMLYKYLKLLIKWRKTQRLISSDDPFWIVDNVIADSLLFGRVIPGGIVTLCDVGSGAGIPGIPLAVAMPDVRVTLLEARQKRASFLATAIRELPLPNCRLVSQRLEETTSQLRRQFDVVVMRCAGSPTSAFPDVALIVAPGGVVVASGPPEPYPLALGAWVEINGPQGSRRFWVHHVT